MKPKFEFIDEKLFLTTVEEGMVEIKFKYENGRTYSALAELDRPHVFNMLMQVDSDDFPEGLLVYNTEGTSSYDKGFQAYEIVKFKGSSRINVTLGLAIDLASWSNPCSVVDFSVPFLEEMEAHDLICNGIEFDDGAALFEIHGGWVDGDITIGKGVSNLISVVQAINDAVIQRFIHEHKERLFVKVFNFPEGYQTVCTQYLIWFGELLSELGIKAAIHSEQNGNQTKIIVAPENASEMLSEVERLFNMYLSLPYSEFLPAQNAKPYEKMMLSNLEAQVNNFKSQVQMKDAIIEFKTATIDSLQEKVEKQANELLLLKSLSEDYELVKDGVAIGVIQWGPLKIKPKWAAETLKKLLPKK